MTMKILKREHTTFQFVPVGDTLQWGEWMEMTSGHRHRDLDSWLAELKSLSVNKIIEAGLLLSVKGMNNN